MKQERIIHGVVASVGTAIGKAVRTFDPLFVSFNFKLRPDQVRKEIERFRASVEKSREQLKRMQSELKRNSGPESSFLIDAHLLVLQDRLFVDRIIEKIESDYINAEWAIQQVSDDLFQAYDRLSDEYLRERRGDLDDIVRRLLHNLQSKPLPSFKKLPYEAILVGKLVPPSTLFGLRSKRIVGLATETGSPLSHTAIMARSLEIPAVVGAAELSEVSSGDLLIVDGERGVVIWAPSEETLAQYKNRDRDGKKLKKKSGAFASAPSVTEDSVQISLGANINFSEEVRSAVAHGCQFIGLYRTEFDFFRQGKQPDEESLVADYSLVLKSAKGAPLTFRTIDVGIDQKSWDGVNMNLGVRGLRFCLENKDLFKKQLRSVYRASVHGPTRLLLPFVSSVDDLDSAHAVIAEVQAELSARRQAYDPHVPIGVMIETPAAAQTCDLMASRVDFFCLGTNDLIQYYLVIDRSDQSVVHLYNPFHPAILRCLQQVYSLLRPTGKPVTVCGEMAADPPSAAVLLGLGFTSLSVSLPAYLRIKRLIRSVSMAQLKDLAAQILKMHKPKEVEEKVRATVYRK
ncbi:MAG: phosphoenolpyruvate--protein phosphotransferase [Acidobacteria bacterium]|nr:MAG: phosphoenolpyruvate--protein phosphotransferase [Acidobacteriota bacterium]